MSLTDLRCDQNPSKLLGRARLVEGNLIEIACDHCKATMRRSGRHVRRVLHRWDVTGELIETEVIE